MERNPKWINNVSWHVFRAPKRTELNCRTLSKLLGQLYQTTRKRNWVIKNIFRFWIVASTENIVPTSRYIHWTLEQKVALVFDRSFCPQSWSVVENRSTTGTLFWSFPLSCRDFEYFINSHFGNCFTFNTKKIDERILRSHRTGASYGKYIFSNAPPVPSPSSLSRI